MHDEYEALMAAADDSQKRAEIEQYFLEKTRLQLSATVDEALDVAAEFDRGKKDAVEDGEDFYVKFFDFLSTLIKRRYLGRDIRIRPAMICPHCNEELVGGLELSEHLEQCLPEPINFVREAAVYLKGILVNMKDTGTVRHIELYD